MRPTPPKLPRPTIAPVLVPHGCCAPGCPYCPSEPREALLPHPDEVPEAVERAQERGAGTVELAFYGGDLWHLPRGPRTALLDAAEREFRGGRVSGLRLTLSPESVLRVPLTEFLRRGLTAVELPVHSLDRRVMRRLGQRRHPVVGPEAVGRLKRARVRSIVHLTPGLPGSSHRSALDGCDHLMRARPDAARILPALALAGTRLGEAFEAGRWTPMDVPQAVLTCRELVSRLRAHGVKVIRIGLQPQLDLGRPRQVLGGPWDPGLRLLVEADLLAVQATHALTSVFRFGTRAFTLVVHPAEESFLRGPENRTLRALRQQFRLDQLHIVTVDDQPRGSVRAFPGKLLAADVPPPNSPNRRAS